MCLFLFSRWQYQDQYFLDYQTKTPVQSSNFSFLEDLYETVTHVQNNRGNEGKKEWGGKRIENFGLLV